MDNGFKGRGKNVTGTTSGIHKRGDGVSSGKPAGKDVGYSHRTGNTRPQQYYQSGSQQQRGTTRGLGGGKLIVIVLIAALLFGGGGGFLGGLFGSSSSSSGSSGGLLSGGNLISNLSGLLGAGSGSSSSASSGLDISSLLGGFSGGSSVSTGWSRESNVGTLDKTVASGAREKRTQIIGGGKDVFTIMVYMCGTDLESKSGMATNDLREMAASTIGKNLNIIVYTGGCKQWKTNGISNSVNQVYKVESGKLIPLVDNAGTDSMVKPSTLAGFIQFCTKNYPANRQALIFWDHGGGSVSGYGYDEKNQSAGTMDLAEIRTALQNGGTTFDFIGFDACLMATLETGLMLDDFADYMIASEETEPGIGWYYTNWVTKLSQNTSMSTLDLGKNIVDDFVAECNKRCAGQKTTLSVVDLAELSATVPAELKSFATSTSKLLTGSDYKTVSDARSGTREFAESSRIDQVDLVNLCDNLGTSESKELAEALLGAVKYNKTSASISNAYGISIYFPYNRTSYVNTAVRTYDSIGLGNEYSRCIQQFAKLETGGQQNSSSSGLDITSLLGGSLGSSASSGGLDISSILGMLGGRSVDLSDETVEQTLQNNYFDASKLVWTKEDGVPVIRMDKTQWSQVHDLLLNVWYDDGEGYLNLGLDSMYYFTKDGALVGLYDCTWVAINNQPVMFNYVDTLVDGATMITTGTVPILLNDERADLLVVFENDAATGEEKNAYVAGVRFSYDDVSDEEPAAVAKAAELTAGDTIEFLCDYYTYAGEFSDTYRIGDPITYDEAGLTVSYTRFTDPSVLKATYLFTDIYNNEHWTALMLNDGDNQNANNPDEAAKITTVPKAERVSYEITDTICDIEDSSLGGGKQYRVIIEITNTGDVPIYLDNCVLDFEDNSGHLLHTDDFISSVPDIVQPGERGYFYTTHSSSFEKDTNFDNGCNLVPNVSVEKAIGTLKSHKVEDTSLYENYGGVGIRGRIVNETSSEISMVFVNTVYYDVNGKVLGISGTTVTDVKANSKTSFDDSGILNRFSVADVAEYRVYASELYLQ